MKLKIITLLAVVFAKTTLLQAQLKITPGATLYNNGALVTLADLDLQNNGVLNSVTSSTFLFNGAKYDTIKGTGTTTFNGLTINKTSGAKIFLGSNIKVTGGLTITGGRFDLGNNNVELIYPFGLLSEAENNRIVTGGPGEIFITQLLNKPLAANPGNLGAIISSAQDMGLTTVRRGHKSDSINGEGSIARYYNIIPQNNTNLNATLVFKYFDTQLNNGVESTLGLYGKSGSVWQYIGKDVADPLANYIQKNNLTSLGLFTLGKGTTSIANIGSALKTSTTSIASATQRTKAIDLGSVITDLISVGPNPSNGPLNIALNLVKDSKVIVQVTDATGRIVMQKQLLSSKGTSVETIQLSNQPKGVYIVTVYSSNGSQKSFRITKQ